VEPGLPSSFSPAVHYQQIGDIGRLDEVEPGDPGIELGCPSTVDGCAAGVGDVRD